MPRDDTAAGQAISGSELAKGSGLMGGFTVP